VLILQAHANSLELRASEAQQAEEEAREGAKLLATELQEKASRAAHAAFRMLAMSHTPCLCSLDRDVHLRI
jgi:hypothetical protein